MAKKSSRSLAAKKAWATRRARQKEAEALTAKRSLAAKKAAATRKKKLATLQKAKIEVQSKSMTRKNPSRSNNKMATITKEDMKKARNRVGDRQSCREVFRSERMHVVEYPPQVRVCKFDHCHRQNERRHLAMPFMQFTRFLGRQGLSLHVSFTNEPLESLKQEVFFPPLPNVWYPSLQVCLMNCPNISFEAVMRDFWNTQYLDCEDWYGYPVLDKETPMRTYLRWERMTREDPTFILDVKWTHPCRIDAIPEFDKGGKLTNGRSGKPEYGGTGTNRRDGPIRGFAVVGHNHGKLD